MPWRFSPRLSSPVCPPWNWHTILGGGVTAGRGECLRETQVIRAGRDLSLLGGWRLEPLLGFHCSFLVSCLLSETSYPTQWAFLLHLATGIRTEATSLSGSRIPGSDAGGRLVRYFWVTGSLQWCLSSLLTCAVPSAIWPPLAWPTPASLTWNQNDMWPNSAPCLPPSYLCVFCGEGEGRQRHAGPAGDKITAGTSGMF